MSVTVRGMADVERALAQLGDAARGAAVRDALMLGGEVVRTDAARRSPVDTGNLRASLMVDEPVVTGTGGQVDIGPSTVAPYGIFVEIGTSRMAAQPYLRPALYSQEDRATQEIGQSLQRSIARVG